MRELFKQANLNMEKMPNRGDELFRFCWLNLIAKYWKIKPLPGVSIKVFIPRINYPYRTTNKGLIYGPVSILFLILNGYGTVPYLGNHKPQEAQHYILEYISKLLVIVNC